MWRPKSVKGTVRLAGAQCRGLRDSGSASWPQTAEWNLDGFKYGRFSDGATTPDFNVRRAWLADQVPYSRSAYRKLATVYRERGEDSLAQQVLMEEHNVLLHRSGPFSRRAYRWVTRLTIGHGYRPLRALLLGVLLVAVTAAVVCTQERYLATTTLTPRGNVVVLASHGCTANLPCLDPIAFSFDTVVPLITLGQANSWDLVPTAPTWFRLWLWFAAILGWALATLAALGFTSVVRKE